jgi:hypothetical protein
MLMSVAQRPPVVMDPRLRGDDEDKERRQEQRDAILAITTLLPEST